MCKKSLVVKEFVNNISPDMDKHGNISQEEYDPVTASTAQANNDKRINVTKSQEKDAPKSIKMR